MYRYLAPLLVCFFIVSCSSDDSSSSDTMQPDNEASIADQILTLVNEHRQNEGLNSLSKNSTAEELAITHTRYMIDQGAISHDGFSGRGSELTDKENATSVGENVASSYPTAEAVMNAWLNSSGHRDNIEGDFTHIGIAAIKNENGTYYYTQLFYK